MTKLGTVWGKALSEAAKPNSVTKQAIWTLREELQNLGIKPDEVDCIDVSYNVDLNEYRHIVVMKSGDKKVIR